MTTKICTKCGEEKSLDKFYKANKKISGYQTLCKDCKYIMDKKRMGYKDREPIVNIEGEIWRDIIGYEGYYQISNKGRVKSLARFVDHNNGGDTNGGTKANFLLTPIIQNDYYRVPLSKNGKHKGFTIHRLKALHFIPNPDNKPCINHIDGNKLNNEIPNLEWCTIKENNQHAIRMGLKPPALKGQDSVNAKITNDYARSIFALMKQKNHLSSKIIASYYGVGNTTVKNIASGKSWKHLNLKAA